MTAVVRRLNRLEDRFGTNKPRNVLRIVVVPAGAVVGPAGAGDADLDDAPCKRHLCADGTVMELVVCSAGGMASEKRIDLSSIPITSEGRHR